ncbi:MAG: methyltransferase domain-containing protein [Chloroflexi bacterium]|nr:methyltransferase domain-containing protein [Chloroflexota bacterium]
MTMPHEHRGEHEVFDKIWSEVDPFYPQGDIEECKNFPELWESVKFSRLEQFLPPLPQKSLEVGCGSGGVSLYFQNTRNYHVNLVDLSDAALSFARKNFKANSTESGASAAFVKGDANDLPFEAASFDLVMSFGLLEHFSDIEQPISEQIRVLRKGGIFFADIVTGRFSVDTFSRLPGMVKNAVDYTLAGRPGDLIRAAEADFYENTFSLDHYADVVKKCGGDVQFALGNRPVTSFGRIPVLSGGLLRLYKTDLMQQWWRRFDLSNSGLSKVWGAGWWIMAIKQ